MSLDRPNCWRDGDAVALTELMAKEGLQLDEVEVDNLVAGIRILKPKEKYARTMGDADKTGKEYAWSYVGLLVGRRDLGVCLPKSWPEPDEGRLWEDARLVEAALRTYCDRKRVQENVSDIEARIGREMNWPADELGAFLELDRWFRRYGPLEEAVQSTRAGGNGSIDWARTRQRSLPVHWEEGLIYNPLQKRNISHDPGLLTSLQLSVLHHLAQKYPVVRSAGLRPSAQLQLGIMPFERLRASKELYKAALRRGLRATFVKHVRSMLERLLEWFQVMDVEELPPRSRDEAGLLGARHFEHVWEDACRVAFGDEPGFQECLPKPVYNYFKNGKFKEDNDSNQQRPDILIKLGESKCVLDPKYYDLCNTRPGLGDIVKQFYYAHGWKGKGEPDPFNAFLVPYGRSEGDLEHLGSIVMKNSDTPDERYPPIQVIGLNPRAVLECYVSRCRDDNWLTRLEEIRSDMQKASPSAVST